MSPAPVPRTLHGDETGLLKVTHYPKVEHDDNTTTPGESQGKTESVLGEQKREYGVDRLCVFGEKDVAVALKNTSVRVWDGTQLREAIPRLSANSEARVRALLKAGGGDGEEDARMVACTEDGMVQVRRWPDAGKVVLEPLKLAECLDGAALHMGKLAVGGNKCNLKIWDLATQQTTFEARNVANDHLDMAVPIWITDVAFGRANPNLVFTSTAYNQLRAYDQRQRRPVKDVSLKLSKNDDGMNHHITCLKITPEDLPIAADNHGDVTLVDMMNTGRMVAKYKGNKGGVRCMDLNEDARTLAVGGMDRIVRVYSLDSRRVVGRCYAKQRITAITSACFPVEKNSGGGGDGEEDEDEDAWSEESENELEEDDDDDDDEEEEQQQKKPASKKSRRG